MVTIISLAAAIVVEMSALAGMSTQIMSVLPETIVTSSEGTDKPLGRVNVCDSNGQTCFNPMDAFMDGDNGRVYLLWPSGHSTIKIYAQRSNDSRWPYMVRRNDTWYYFDL